MVKQDPLNKNILVRENDDGRVSVYPLVSSGTHYELSPGEVESFYLYGKKSVLQVTVRSCFMGSRLQTESPAESPTMKPANHPFGDLFLRAIGWN